jgi:hypothetical protein
MDGTCGGFRAGLFVAEGTGIAGISQLPAAGVTPHMEERLSSG